MADIEKVIKGLTQCTSVNKQKKCHKCPYWGSNNGFSACDDMKVYALKLLKEQKNLIDGLIEDQLKKDEEQTGLIKEQQAKIKYLKSEKERLSCQNEALKKKKGHWEMKFRHHKSVKHVKGYDAYDVEREIELVEETEGYEPYCSECGAAAAESFLCFCPKCGADMRESIKKDGEQE